MSLLKRFIQYGTNVKRSPARGSFACWHSRSFVMGIISITYSAIAGVICCDWCCCQLHGVWSHAVNTMQTTQYIRV